MTFLALTGSELALHQLGLGSLPCVEQPTLPVRPQHQSRGPAVRGRVGRASAQESHVHAHPLTLHGLRLLKRLRLELRRKTLLHAVSSL